MKPVILSCVSIFFYILCGSSLGETLSTSPPSSTVREALNLLNGETLSYDIAFLWFDRLAIGEFSFHKTAVPDRYHAVLEARTVGVAAWLTGNRVQRYTSVLQLADDGSLRPLSYHADMYKSRGDTVKTRLKKWEYDYSRRVIVEKVVRNGRPRKPTTYSMGNGPLPYDILGAFYNFRTEKYGPIRGGAAYHVPTFAKGVPSAIDIAVFSDDRRPGESFFPSEGLVVKVVVDPEVFDTGNGNLYIWFDNNLRPGRVLVKDVVGLGDVRASLRSDREEQ